MKKINIEIRKIKKDNNYQRFSNLFLKCFRQKTNTNFFKWKYFDNPAGEILGYEALYKDKTIASYGFLPEFYQVGEEKIKIFQAVDAMVSPRFWGRNLFFQLAKKTQEEALHQEKRTFAINFPGQLSQKEFLTKLDWQLIKKDCGHIFIPYQYHRFKKLFTWSKKIKIVELLEVDKGVVAYFNQLVFHTKNSKFFDADIFQWKIFDNPIKDYSVLGIKDGTKLLGICVYRRDTSKSCEISWLNFSKKEDYKYIPQVVDYIFYKLEIRYIHTWTPLNYDLLLAFQEAGFIKNSFSKGPYKDTFPYLVYTKGSTLKTDTQLFEGNELYPIYLD